MDEAVIYLDHHATTACDPSVVEAMVPWMTQFYGNPHSTSHLPGRYAADKIAAEQADLAARIGAVPEEIVFTSGATESNNLALFGVMLHPRQRRRHLVTLETEHPSVLDPVERLRAQGVRITRLPVIGQGHSRAGMVDLDQLHELLDDDTALVSIMLANNEIGVLQPLTEIADLCHQRGILLHTDATQALGKIALHVDDLGVDLMSFSAHKFYGPKGVGGLFVRHRDRRIRLLPQIEGGGQQFGLRSGTLNVPGIIGMCAALRLCDADRDGESSRITGLRDRLWLRLQNLINGIECNGPSLDLSVRLAGNLNIQLPQVEGESVMMATPQIAMSSGSACSSAEPGPSHVLMALGLSETAARRSLRMGLGRFTTEAEIDRAAELLAESYHRLARLVS